jgi:hypothetical protein
MAVRFLLATLIFASGLIYLPDLLSASAQQGLVRSQSEAVQGAVQNQLRERPRPDPTKGHWVETRGAARASARRQQSWYVGAPPRAAVK